MNARWVIYLGLIWLLALPKPGAWAAERFWLQAKPTETPTLTPSAAILAPLAGQAVQGRVPVLVNTAAQDFQVAELYFGYAGDPTGTWFLIAQSSEPVMAAEAGTWDTSLITDGDYDLRLVVFLEDGNQVEMVVRGLRVRNYSPVETDTPTPIIPTDTPLPGELPTSTATLQPTVTPTSTPLPTNPAEMTGAEIARSLSRGALAAVGAFALLGAYIWIRLNQRKRNSLDDGTN
jgi:hypothetical protein